jgi:hypothetical protein
MMIGPVPTGNAAGAALAFPWPDTEIPATLKQLRDPQMSHFSEL